MTCTLPRRARHAKTAILLPALIALGLLAPRIAHAGDEPSGIASAVGALKEARKEQDEEKLAAAITGIVEAHNASENAKQRSQAQAALGGLLKDKKLPAARSQAVRGIGQLNDPKGSFKLLKGLLPTAKTRADDTFAITVLKAVAELKADAAVAPLLKLLGGTKEPLVASPTATALGVYAGTKQQEPIAQGLIDALQRYKAAYDKAEKGKQKPEAKGPKQALWVQSAPAVAAALNALTGESREAPADWLAAYAEAKGKIGAFFPKK